MCDFHPIGEQFLSSKLLHLFTNNIYLNIRTKIDAWPRMDSQIEELYTVVNIMEEAAIK